MKNLYLLFIVAVLSLPGCRDQAPAQQLGQETGEGETPARENIVEPTCEELDAQTEEDLGC